MANVALADAMQRVLTRPDPSVLWDLRTELLESGVSAESRIWTVVEEFHRYLDRLATSTTSRDYSHMASKLDITAVGGVVGEQLLEQEEPEKLGLRLLSAMLTEGLMILATRQHVKAWEGELNAVYRDAAWFLFGELWRWSSQRQPSMTPAERRGLLEPLLQPARSEDTPGIQKAVLLGHLFQVLLISYLPGSAGGR